MRCEIKTKTLTRWKSYSCGCVLTGVVNTVVFFFIFHSHTAQHNHTHTHTRIHSHAWTKWTLKTWKFKLNEAKAMIVALIQTYGQSATSILTVERINFFECVPLHLVAAWISVHRHKHVFCLRDAIRITNETKLLKCVCQHCWLNSKMQNVLHNWQRRRQLIHVCVSDRLSYSTIITTRTKRAKKNADNSVEK